MPSIYVKQFGGLIPQLANRLLPDNNAQTASNLKLVSGELRPLRKPKSVSTPTNAFPATTVFQARNGSSSAWLTWQADVDVVRAPLPAEVESRYYWSGEGEPRYGTFTFITNSGTNNYPSARYALGVPTPQTKPVATPTGGAGSNVTRFYCYTFFSALGEESGPSPISVEVTNKVDASWAISAMDAFPANSGTGTATHLTGVTSFTNGASAAHWLRVGDEVVISGTTVKVASVPTASSFTVLGNFAAATTWARKANWNTSGMTRRLYRTTGTTGKFQLVAANVGTTYADTITDANILGDALISSGWAPPDPLLKGFTVHASGALCAFNGTQLQFSVPYQPHAWVSAYTLGTDYEIVGIATFGSEIAVTTKGTPAIASGVDPESMTLEKIASLYPCLSKRSVTSVGDGAIYASIHGLVYVGLGGVRIFTDKFFTRDEWEDNNPAAMITAFAFGKVFLATTGTNGQSYVLVFDGDTLTSADIAAYDLYTEASTGSLYLGTATDVGEWDSPLGAPLTSAWRSKMFVSPPPVNLSAAKIEFDPAIEESIRTAILAERSAAIAANASKVASGNTLGSVAYPVYNALSINGSRLVTVPDEPSANQVSFTLYSKGLPVFSRVISNEKAFRLPAGYKSDEVEFQVSSQCVINAVRIASSMTALNTV